MIYPELCDERKCINILIFMVLFKEYFLIISLYYSGGTGNTGQSGPIGPSAP